MEKVIVTGALGFIGSHVCRKLKSEGYYVVGIDVSHRDGFTEPQLWRRLNTPFMHEDLGNGIEVHCMNQDIWADASCIVHLAAKAGVRESVSSPHLYNDPNLIEFFRVLQLCNMYKLPLIYASSSSVYGDNPAWPSIESQRTDNPASYYAATKKCNEVMAQSFTSMYGLTAIGLRFFTVYGEYGRPDMAPWLFAERIMRGEEVMLYDNGEGMRSWTYIDDVVRAIVRCVKQRENEPFKNRHELLNIGGDQPYSSAHFLDLLETAIGIKAKRRNVPAMAGDVRMTYANIDKAKMLIGWEPQVSLRDGVDRFGKWFKQHFDTYMR
jgi:UDP-glucuronate 4-epimerase